MLVSPTKHRDQEIAIMLMEIIEIAHRVYTKNPTPQLYEYLEKHIDMYQKLQRTIDTQDYTAKDKAYFNLNKWLSYPHNA